MFKDDAHCFDQSDLIRAVVDNWLEPNRCLPNALMRPERSKQYGVFSYLYSESLISCNNVLETDSIHRFIS